MASSTKGSTKSGYDSNAFQALMQKLADAAQELDVYTFSNEVPAEHVQQAKDIVANVNKLCTSALTRKTTKIQVQLN